MEANGATRALAERYAVSDELGRGGMATVYLARDLRHDRPVAIKVLHPELAASLGATRFLNEIRIAARLSHPHILPLIDSGEAGGLLYYVTPHVSEGSLRQRLEADGKIGVEEALAISAEIGAALDYAHRQGFVHRDVKPDNILFADGIALLADFGIAQACCAVGVERITEIGIALGTPEYMSPEQAAGEQDLTGASDQYSLACVVYEMLTGQPPLRGDSARATIARHVTQTPQPLRAHRPDAPAHVEQALARALAKDPADRFATVREFIAALQENPGGASTAVIASGGACIAVLPFVNASTDPENEYLSDGISEELIDALASVEGLRVASRTSTFALKDKPQDVRAIGALLGATLVLEGTVRRSGNRLRISARLTSTRDGQLLWSQRFDRRLEDVFEIQEAIAHTIVSTLRSRGLAGTAAPVSRRYTSSVAAYNLYLRGRYEWNKRSQESMAAAISYFEQAIAEDPAFAPAYAGIADSYALGLDYRSVPVKEGFTRAKEFARRALALDDTLAEAHASLAWSMFIYDWDWEGSEREFRRALALDPRYATAHQWYAFWLVTRGRMDEALVSVHTALELDPASASIRRSVGWAYFYARRYQQARDHAQRAVVMNPTSEESYRVLGLALAMMKEFDAADRAFREATALPAAGPYSKAQHAYVLAAAGRRNAALRILAELEELSNTSYVSPIGFATMHIGLGNFEKALDWIERGMAERRGWLAYIAVNPVTDPLRDLPRFNDLLRKMRLDRVA